MITSIFAGIGILFCALIVIAFIGKILHLTVSDKDLYDKLVVVEDKLDQVINTGKYNQDIKYIPVNSPTISWHNRPTCNSLFTTDKPTCTSSTTITTADVDKVQADNKVVC